VVSFVFINSLMSQVAKSVLVPYSAETMFALVDAVERYPEFLPWCSSTEVHSRDALQTVATINIRYAGVAQSFTTENEKEGVTWMRINLRDGPFKTLRGAWHFRVLSATACKVELELEYTFANNLLERAVGPVFGMIAETMMDRFVARADALYGANVSVVP
jgi:ribosome-associated toxin RatA of RatAB toxin-antitoxin module